MNATIEGINHAKSHEFPYLDVVIAFTVVQACSSTGAALLNATPRTMPFKATDPVWEVIFRRTSALAGHCLPSMPSQEAEISPAFALTEIRRTNRTAVTSPRALSILNNRGICRVDTPNRAVNNGFLRW